MTATLDDLAGVVDLFDGLTRPELTQALVELGARRGETPDEDAVEETIEDAIEAYFLVRYDRADEGVLVAGPAAFPTLPDHAEDLPHIMDVPERSLSRDRLGLQVRDRLADDVAAAVERDDHERLEELRDVSYDVEAWAPVDLSDVRERIDRAIDG